MIVVIMQLSSPIVRQFAYKQGYIILIHIQFQEMSDEMRNE